jgi:pimeloyl-ACP methyl ester carboxylesterase
VQRPDPIPPVASFFPDVVGWSLGGHIALEAAPGLPTVAGYVVFGTVQVIPGAGHALHQEAPEAFTVLLEDFITDLP